MKKFLFDLRHTPNVLEVGVDRGVSYITLATFLARTKQSFNIIGVDVLIQEQVQIMAQNLDVSEAQRLYVLQENSLTALPKLARQFVEGFDLVLLDGDHNYYTVNEELKHLESLTRPGSLVIIDDYEGRWSERDLWYSTRPEYVDVKDASKPIEGDKHGVKLAVDEFLSLHPIWSSSRPIQGEPIMLERKE
jgi:predicted O-methyltransferase YrrM